MTFEIELKVTRNISTYRTPSNPHWLKVSLKTGHLGQSLMMDQLALFPSRYLEPYEHRYKDKAGEIIRCDTLHTNCMACTADYKCAWDEPNSSCIDREARSSRIIETGSQKRILTDLKLYPSECVSCEKHIYCNTCVKETDGGCTWVEDTQEDQSRCVRKNRYANDRVALTSSIKVIGSLSECPVPCHRRETCASCVGNVGKCV